MKGSAIAWSLMFLSCAKIGTGKMFTPLSCNANLSLEPCNTWSSQNYNLTNAVLIPCGTCIIIDESTPGDLILEKGLNIEGKLYIPPLSFDLSITTSYIFVQGELFIDPPSSVIPSDNKVEFILFGTDPVVFHPHAENMNNCGVDGCDLSKKAVVIAGGKIDVRGMPSEQCPSWTRLADVERDDSPLPASYQQAPTVKDGCSAVLVDQDFSSASDISNWDGYGSTAQIVTDSDDGNSFYSLSERSSSSLHGPRVFLPFECITPNEPYLLSLKYRLSPITGSDATLAHTNGGHIPDIRMVRSQFGTGTTTGNEWPSVNQYFLHPRGSMGTATDGEWHHITYTMLFNEQQASSSETNALFLYLQGSDGGAVVDVDDFKLELAPETVFPGATCTDLLRNGNSDMANGHVYPFYAASGGVLYTVSNGDGPNNSEGPYFRHDTRHSEYSKVLSQDLNPGCIVPGTVYEFKGWVRIHSDTERSAVVQVWTKNADTGAMGYHTITNCPASSDGQWVECTSLFTFTEYHANSSEVNFHVRVPGDTSSTVDWANVSFAYVVDRASSKTLILEDAASVKDCWGPGAEVLITSHTVQYDDVQVATIQSIDAISGKVTLVDSITSPITLADDPLTGVEVALLSRNVIFRAVKDDDPDHPLHGGHLIFLHTPSVVQLLEGVEVNGFGQQGSLGRYSIHFHMCNSVEGSAIKKNLIRGSNQRCVVIHNTNDVEVSDNVAFDTFGHCFILEDGGEQNNAFVRNLGAVTKSVQILISDAESDSVPATFWITNPVNTWIGNVAAGSEGPGFWFEVSGSVRGGSKKFHQSMIPNRLPLQKFIDNVSHSNSRNGLQTYPQSGYNPPEQAIFQNHRSYRNRQAGVFFHAGGKLSLDGGYFADNRIGVKIDADHSDQITNSVIIGVSNTYKDVIDSMGQDAYLYPARAQCTSDATAEGNPVTGIRLDSYFWGGTRATGTLVSNVTFSGFGTLSCSSSSVLDTDDHSIHFFDPRNILEGISIDDDSNPVNLCKSADYGIKDIAIYDKEGYIIGAAGFIVSDSDIMKADTRCTSIEGTCAAYCPNVCLRTMTVGIPSYASPDTKLHISGTSSDGQPINTVTWMSYAEESKDPTNWNAHRSMRVALPAGGDYAARFTEGDGQETIWPVYASTSYEDTPNECGPEFTSFEFNQPIPNCDELIVNGDAGDSIVNGSTKNWQHIAGGVKLKSPGADGTDYSLLSESGGRWYGLAQYLDTRCMVKGTTYAFHAKLKLTNSSNNGTLFECNVNGWSSDPKSCPRATIRAMYGLTDPVSDWQHFASMIESDKEWNILKGTFTVSEFYAGAGTVGVYVNGAPAGIDIQIDQVSITHVPATASPTSSPTKSPTSLPTVNPTTLAPVPENAPPLHQSTADFNDGVSFDGDAVIFSSVIGQDETILTKMAHVGAGESGDIEIMIKYLKREMLASGYQPALALFFADENASIDDVTGSDNTYETFESTAVATVRDKCFETMDHVWFYMHNKSPDGTTSNTFASDNYKMMTGFIKLKRSAGFVSAHHSINGEFWYDIGVPKELPDDYKISPLKIGLRIKREWKTHYSLTVRPTITSGGAL